MKNMLWMIVFFFITSPVFGHFGMVIPSDTMIMNKDSKVVNLKLSFSHPFESIGMPLEKPKFWLFQSGNPNPELLQNLGSISVLGERGWELNYRVRKPGGFWFYMEPQPYWEPSEDVFIIHHTKTYITAFGDDSGWDEELGLATEIIPVSKPFGLYAGNLFQGIVKLNGKIVPFAEVEVEYYNQGRNLAAPSEYMVTQTIKSDANGVFSYSVPAAGWWGFAALNESDKTIAQNNQPKNVELGAVIWVKFHSWPRG